MKLFNSPIPRLQFLDDDGRPLANGILKTFIAGSSLPVATYNGSGTKNPVQIRLDSRGECDVRLRPDLAYKFVLCREDGSVIWTTDNIRVGCDCGGDDPEKDNAILAENGVEILTENGVVIFKESA